MDLPCRPQAYNGNTALHVAASLQYRVSQLDAVRLLMRKGADPSARNLENEQPVHLVPDGLVGEQVKKIPTNPFLPSVSIHTKAVFHSKSFFWVLSCSFQGKKLANAILFFRSLASTSRTGRIYRPEILGFACSFYFFHLKSFFLSR